jgi:poly(3-hydroxybutyrate) depolymerase
MTPSASLVLAMSLVAAMPAGAEVKELSRKVGATTVRYKVVLPTGYDAARTYPAVLVFGGGPQTMNTVDRTLENNFRAEAEQRGFIVIAPAAPDGDLFFQEGARTFPEFLRLMLADYRIQDGKFHAAGPSNGGIAAMHVAAAHPQYFVSATAFPGYLWQPSEAKLRALAKTCVFLYVGEHDDYQWHSEMKREAEFLRGLGGVARYTEEKGQPHGIATLRDAGAGRLFDDFAQARKGCEMKR